MNHENSVKSTIMPTIMVIITSQTKKCFDLENDVFCEIGLHPTHMEY